MSSSEIPKQIDVSKKAAIRAATDHYKKRQWSVRSVKVDKCGYDLHCRKGGEEIHVEVKGTQGDGSDFVLTAGEYRKAAEDAKLELCTVKFALVNPTILRFESVRF
jgi:Domain of unknown function (DUF3883)